MENLQLKKSFLEQLQTVKLQIIKFMKNGWLETILTC